MEKYNGCSVPQYTRYPLPRGMSRGGPSEWDRIISNFDPFVQPSFFYPNKWNMMNNNLNIIYVPYCMILCSHSKSNGSNFHIDCFHLSPKSLTLPRNDKVNKKKICKFRFSPLIFEHGSSIRGFMRIPYGLFRLNQRASSGSFQTLPFHSRYALRTGLSSRWKKEYVAHQVMVSRASTRLLVPDCSSP